MVFEASECLGFLRFLDWECSSAASEASERLGRPRFFGGEGCSACLGRPRFLGPGASAAASEASECLYDPLFLSSGTSSPTSDASGCLARPLAFVPSVSATSEPSDFPDGPLLRGDSCSVGLSASCATLVFPRFLRVGATEVSSCASSAVTTACVAFGLPRFF